MQRHHGGDAQRAKKVQDVGAVVAAEDAILVLHRNPADVLVVDQLGGARIVALCPLPDLVLDLLGILVGPASSVTATTRGLTRALAAPMPAARSRVNVAMPQRRGGYVPRKAIRRSSSTAASRTSWG